MASVIDMQDGEDSASLKIDKKIIAWSVRKDGTNSGMPPALTYNRDDELDGTTYKIKPPTIQCAVYITINHARLPDGSLRPLEVFINSKHTEHHQWIVALTRMISAVFRKPGEIEFAIDELEQVFDPQGGYWYDKKYQPSLVAHVGSILRRHCEKIGAISKRELTIEQKVVVEEKIAEAKHTGVDMMLCPNCKELAMLMQEGCETCTNCGESKCE